MTNKDSDIILDENKETTEDAAVSKKQLLDYATATTMGDQATSATYITAHGNARFLTH